MVQYHPRALFLVLVIGVSLWMPGCLAQDETTSTKEGTCDAYDPKTCEAEESDCQDGHPKCSDWSQKGECENNPGYMLSNCKRSCLQCPDQAYYYRERCGLCDRCILSLSLLVRHQIASSTS